MSLAAYWRLMRFHRPIGIWLLAWPTAWALWAASAGHPNWFDCGFFLLGVVVMRAAGCVANDLADYRFDAQVTRTRDRPLACGELQPRQARYLLISLLGVALLMWWQLLPLAKELAIVALLLALSYPYAKRFCVTPQLVLGLAFAVSVPIVYAQLTQRVPWSALWLFLATCWWVIAYDTQYALSDREEDTRIGIHSSARFFGRHVYVAIVLLQVLMLMTLCLWAWSVQAAPGFYLSLVVVLGLFVYQAYTIRRQPLAQHAQQAFRHNQWVGLAVFIGIFFAR